MGSALASMMRDASAAGALRALPPAGAPSLQERWDRLMEDDESLLANLPWCASAKFRWNTTRDGNFTRAMVRCLASSRRQNVFAMKDRDLSLAGVPIPRHC